MSFWPYGVRVACGGRGQRMGLEADDARTELPFVVPVVLQILRGQVLVEEFEDGLE